MLGDVDPETLAIIASGKDVAAEEKKRQSLWKGTREEAQTVYSEADGKEIDHYTVLHTIDQEIRRLEYFKDSPPGGKVTEATVALKERESEITDSEWDVRLVELALEDDTTLLVTYGELNTLADFYGSAKEIAQTPADNFRGIVAGVREESLRKFMRLRNELTVSGKKQYKPEAEEHKVKGSIGNTGPGTARGSGVKGRLAGLFAGSDATGELKLMGEASKEDRRGQ